MNIIMDSTRKFGILWEENSECNGFILWKNSDNNRRKYIS